MNYLFVVAHPDDEVIGAGATIMKLARQGHNVNVCCLTDFSPTRKDELKKVMYEMHDKIGIKVTLTREGASMKLKDEDHYELVQFIEKAIQRTKADVAITHHPADLHNDHYITSICCQEAVRLPQRQIGYNHKVKGFYFMEVLSSTEWALNPSFEKFSPDTFVEVEPFDVYEKINLLSQYDKVIRDMPHPRSQQSFVSLSVYRGVQSGYHHAEAFQTGFKLEL